MILGKVTNGANILCHQSWLSEELPSLTENRGLITQLSDFIFKSTEESAFSLTTEMSIGLKIQLKKTYSKRIKKNKDLSTNLHNQLPTLHLHLDDHQASRASDVHNWTPSSLQISSFGLPLPTKWHLHPPTCSWQKLGSPWYYTFLHLPYPITNSYLQNTSWLIKMLHRTWTVGLFLVRFIYIQPCNTWYRYISGVGTITVTKIRSFDIKLTFQGGETTNKISRYVM